MLLRQHPELYHRSCADCLVNIYDEETGRVVKDRSGKPEPRPKGCSAPCRKRGDSCPKGTPEDPVTLNVRNELAYAQFRRCRVTGRWPDDPLVEERAVILDEIESLCRDERNRESQLQMLVSMQLGRFRRTGG